MSKEPSVDTVSVNHAADEDVGEIGDVSYFLADVTQPTKKHLQGQNWLEIPTSSW